jgi:hypothetical protein
MDFLKSIFRRPSRDTRVPTYDEPFAVPRTRRIVIPPKPGNLKGRSIAPRPPEGARIHRSVNQIRSSEDQTSVLLFGSPLDSVKTADTVGNVRYPTTALFNKK